MLPERRGPDRPFPTTAPIVTRRRRTIAVLVLALIAGSARPADAALTAADRVARIYALILDAAFDEAEAEIATCQPIPADACLVLEATRLWWAIQLDPHSTALDARFERAASAAIAACEAWAGREPRRAEAWFYLGGAYGTRVQWRVLRVERLAAARDGKRIKEVLERAIALDPQLEDAYFGVGLYKYYAAVAPAGARMLRWLLLLPGGDRSEGLGEMLRAGERGEILHGEADYQIHIVYLWYEKRFTEALALLRDLSRTYPRNPLFAWQIGDVEDVYFHDLSASRDAYASLLARSARGDVNGKDLADAQARLGLARQLDALYETDRAIDLLSALVARKPAEPYAALAQAQMMLGTFYDRVGLHALSTTAFAAAHGAIPADDRLGLARRVRDSSARTTPQKTADAYRIALQGWRAFERRDDGEALRLLERAVAANPVEPVARYRYAHVLAARQQPAQALDEYERVIAASDRVPPAFLARALFEAAALVERSGDPDRALEYFDRATSTFGADRDTIDAAQRAVSRLRSR